MQRLANGKSVATLFALTLAMFVAVMFFVNPTIDKGNGLEVISLQLAFDTKRSAKQSSDIGIWMRSNTGYLSTISMH